MLHDIARQARMTDDLRWQAWYDQEMEVFRQMSERYNELIQIYFKELPLKTNGQTCEMGN